MAKISEDRRRYVILPFLVGAVLCLAGCVDVYDAPPLVKPPHFLQVSTASAASNNAAQTETSSHSAPSENKPKSKKPKTSSEALLNAEGNWNLVEETSENDPALAHQRARDKVDPRRRNVMSELSPHFTPDAKSGEDGKMRVLKLQPNEGGNGDLGSEEGFEVAETSVSKPTHKVVKPQISSKINSLFAKEKAELITTVETVEAAEMEAAPAQAPVESAPVVKAPEKEGGFFDKLTSVFSSDENEIEGKPEVMNEENAPVTAAPPVQEKSLHVSDAGMVLPPQTPARKLDNAGEAMKMPVVVASESAATTSESGAQDIISVEAQQSGQVHSIGMRAAMHPSKTRLAFDFSGAVKYKVAIDHIRNVLRIKFENALWGQEQQGSLDEDSDMLGSYVVRKQADGSIIFEVRLREKSVVQDAMILRPGTSPHHRVVIDLKKAA